MLEIIVLNKDFQELGSITSFEGIRWTRRWASPGNYEMVVSNQYFDMVMAGFYLVIDGKDETGLIEIIDYDEQRRKIVVSGLFIEKKLDSRLLDNETILTGVVESALHSMVRRFTSGDRLIPLLELDEDHGRGCQINTVITDVSLMEKLYETANYYGFGIKLIYKYIENKLVFSVWEGKNRTSNQTDNSFAVFSENEGNVLKAVYYRDETNHKNFAYVLGNPFIDGGDPVRVTVNNILDDEERREVLIKVTDAIHDAEKSMTLPEYEEFLIQKGLEDLMEYQRIENILFEVNGNLNLIYKTDYDLGDKVTYQDDKLGISVDLRITEVTEIYERNQVKILLTLGDENKTEIERIRRKVL
jgi:hypothetical protein